MLSDSHRMQQPFDHIGLSFPKRKQREKILIQTLNITVMCYIMLSYSPALKSEGDCSMSFRYSMEQVCPRVVEFSRCSLFIYCM